MANIPGSRTNKPIIFVVTRRTIGCLILLIAVVFLITSNTFWRWMYPISYQPVIQAAAAHSQVDPLLIASVIRTESKFRTEDISHAGAIGLMQLMPSSAQWIAQQMQAEDSASLTQNDATGKINLAQPEVNIRLGSWYIRYLEKRFNNNQVAAIAAYNAGPKRVSEWLANGTWDGSLNTINDIPVGETRHFVDRVFYNYSLYQRIYRGDTTLDRPT